MSLSDAEIRRLRDLDALLTHVGITTLSDADCQASLSMDRMLFKFATYDNEHSFGMISQE